MNQHTHYQTGSQREPKAGASPREVGSNPLVLLTVPEVADLLRTSPKAVYTMIERAQLPGVVRIRKRVLINRTILLDWLSTTTCTPSLEHRR